MLGKKNEEWESRKEEELGVCVCVCFNRAMSFSPVWGYFVKLTSYSS